MSVFVDPIFTADPMFHVSSNPLAKQAARHGKRWCHMWADTEKDLPELHRIARAIGLKAAWFQNRKDFPHYDLIPSKRAAALKVGAVEKSLVDWLREVVK